MKHLILAAFLTISTAFFAQNFTSEEVEIDKKIGGTLLLPEGSEARTLVIFIAGSGPTDRDGNQPMMKNNSLKYLAESLSRMDIATYRFDKRTVRLAQRGNLNEESIKFDDFIDDVKTIIDHFKADERFSKILLAGHSKGSLIGMIAAQEGVDGFISIAGAGQVIDNVIVDQLSRQAPSLTENARQNFDEMRKTGKATTYNEGLASIFRESLQPFMLTWMRYDPQEEISRLDCPVLILNGTEDVQVDENEARLLHQARPDAEFYLIENMNHVLKQITKGDTMENGKSYNNPNLPVMTELIQHIADFVKSI